MDFLIYLNTLLEVERNKQILTVILIWTAMISIAGICEFLKYRFKGKTKNVKFQKFLERI